MTPLDQNAIFEASSRARVIGSTGEIHDVVESTMDVARERGTAAAGDGYVVLAEQQRSGRGRDGRWECPSGKGLLMSIVLRLGLRRSERMLLGFMGAVAAAETFQSFGTNASVKWPNDIVVTAPAKELRLRKLGGVLVEQFSRGDAAPGHLLGLGLNLNQTQDELPECSNIPATSLMLERHGEPVDRDRFCRQLLNHLDEWYGRLRLGRSGHLLARWRSLSCLPGKRIRARVRDQIITGTVTGLRATGELLLREDNGRTRVLKAEHTTLLLNHTRR